MSPQDKVAPKAKKIDQSELALVRDERLTNARRDLWTQYAPIIEAFDGLIYICSQDYKIELMNRQFIDRTGHNVVGEKCYKALHDREDICPWCVNDRVFQGETVRSELFSSKDHRWYYMVNSLIQHSDGSISNMAMLQEITESKAMHEALRHAQEDYQGIFENAAEGIFRSKQNGRL